MQTASARVWTCVAVSMNYNDNHCTINAFINNKKNKIKQKKSIND